MLSHALTTITYEGELTMNFDKLDKVVFRNVGELKTLLSWRDNNKELVRNFKPILKEGVVVYHENNIYFKMDDEFVYYELFLNDVKMLKFTAEKKTVNGVKMSQVVDRENINLKDDYVEEATQDCVTIIASLMAYMEHYTEFVTVTKERKVTKKKGKGGNKNKDKVIKIGRRVYDISIPTDLVQREEKRQYERHVETWPVRSHPRTYKKSGKTIMIEGYQKGDKTKDPKPRTFKM